MRYIQSQFDYDYGILVSQYFSIVSSALIILKTAIELLSYERPKEEKVTDLTEESTEKQEKTSEKVVKILRKLLSFLAWVPLILIRKVFKISL